MYLPGKTAWKQIHVSVLILYLQLGLILDHQCWTGEIQNPSEPIPAFDLKSYLEHPVWAVIDSDWVLGSASCL